MEDNVRTVQERKYTNAEAADILHKVSNFYVVTKKAIDYGTGEIYTSVEAHTVKYIADNPGITVTEIAKDYGRTKGAISQILKKLEDKELIYRETDTRNSNKQFLFITKKGEELNEIHRQYDEISFGESINYVKNMLSEEEVNNAFKVLEVWLDVRRDIHQKRMKKQKLKNKELCMKLKEKESNELEI